MKLRQFFRIHQIPLICVLIVFFFASRGFSSPLNQLPIGARPMGMGESFVAVANDSNAIAWNPAGLVQLRNQAINSMYTDLYGVGLTHSYLSYALPLTDRHAIGIDWAHLGFNDDELNFRDDRVSLSYGIQLIRQLSLGANIKYVSIDTGLDGNSLGPASGFGVDIGMRFEPIQRLSFGIFGQDLTDTKVMFDETDNKDTIALRRFRIGVAYKPTDTAVIALDVDNRIHLGAEQWLGNVFAVRGGIAGDLGSFSLPDSDDTFREPISFSLGGSLKYNLLQFDYAYLNSPTLKDTHRFSMTLAFDYNPKLVRLESIRLADVLASFYRQYATPSPLCGELVLTSKHDNELQISVSLFVPKYMDAPTEVAKEVRLSAAESGQESGKVTIPLSLKFNDKMQSLVDDVQTQAEITITYSYLKRTRELKWTELLNLRRMGKVAYHERLAPMVAFIDPDDSVVRNFANAVVSMPLEIESDSLAKICRANDNIFKAMLIFEALNVHGVKYKEYPDKPFQSIYGKEYVAGTASYPYTLPNPPDLWYIDLNGPFKDARYPRDLLSAADRTGDCDDVSVLYASLLETLGIRTQLVDVGESVFVMFDSGLSENDIKLLQLPPELFIEDSETFWVPVEVTRYGDLFVQAWKEGTFQYESANKQGTLQLVDVHDAWETYQRMHPLTELTSITPPDVDEIDRRIQRNLTEFEELLFGRN